MNFNSVKSLIKLSIKQNIPIHQVVINDQVTTLEITEPNLLERMSNNYEVMKKSIYEGLNQNIKSSSGLSGGDSKKLYKKIKENSTITGPLLSNGLARAIAVGEVNATMGRIVAAPTAGSCGILPGVLTSLQDKFNISDTDIVKGMFTASGIGMVIANKASISGAKGGCQAECGSASAMAAAAIVDILDGDPNKVGHATAIALKNILGLVCDPVAGLVEVPCIKRNAMGVANAFTAAELALAGIESVIPVDEVIEAMDSISRKMSVDLKETSKGGLAATKTGIKIAKIMQ